MIYDRVIGDPPLTRLFKERELLPATFLELLLAEFINNFGLETTFLQIFFRQLPSCRTGFPLFQHRFDVLG